MKIKTIGDMRKFIADFPPEADGYPFLISEDESDPFGIVTAGKVTNDDGHPDYAWLVVE